MKGLLHWYIQKDAQEVPQGVQSFLCTYLRKFIQVMTWHKDKFLRSEYTYGACKIE